MMQKRDWTGEEESTLCELRGNGYSYSEIANKLSEKYKKLFTYDSVRSKLKRMESKNQIINSTGISEVSELQEPSYKETTEILADGSHRSDKLLRMSAEQKKDNTFLLKAHGYEPDEWEVINAKSSIWNQHNKQDGTLTLYASKITVRPKKGFNIDKLLDAIKETQSIIIKTESIKLDNKRMLEIPLFDTHFGISDYEYYKDTQMKILDKLSLRKWEEVLFIIGQDMLHNDNFRGQTANGTQIESVNMVKAWNDARTFYEPLIEKAIKQANIVNIIYSYGNHDESFSWAFIQLLKERYPQVNVDDRMEERKAYSFGNNFIGITHGDKARKNLHNIFPVEFPLEWANAKNREIHTGHLHVEETKDIFGMALRTLATRNRTDKWHKDNGFVGAHKRFMLFEFSESELEAIYYV